MSHEDLKSDLKSKASDLMQEFLQGQDPTDKAKELAAEATEFVRRHPWAAVAGAVAIGYLLGSFSAQRNRNVTR